MDLSTITVSQFKTYFYRDFPYLPNYDATALYNTGDKVYYATTKLFYTALSNGVTGIVPTNATYWAVASDKVLNYVQDVDITFAFSAAQGSFNQGLFGTDDDITLGYLLLSAHFLALHLKTSFGGIMANGGFPVQSRSVGGVSESYAIPAQYLKNAVFAQFTTTSYGMQYLNKVAPTIVGNVFTVMGGTNS
jgi:Protein of unknown function (DUF4054)